ncbi:uncharacterized protein LOC141614013 [Silene latifolia]|uniref:uncharacterized protein LOC141614013 n=1 Tax=Silene latifolia TaxID=37657 RepID=UPI003D772551
MPNIASHSEPTADSIPKGFKLLTNEGSNFDIRPSYINLVERNLFRGVAGEDPRMHMEIFTDYCSTIPATKGMTQEKIKEVLFPFSLTDGARTWLTDLDRTTTEITDWDNLTLAFYKFEKLVRSVPHHGFDHWFLCNQFYNGLYDDHCAVLDGAANEIFQKNIDDAKGCHIIEEMPTHCAEYENPRSGIHLLSRQETDSCERCGADGHTAVDCLVEKD